MNTITILTEAPSWSANWLGPWPRVPARLVRHFMSQLRRRQDRAQRQTGPLSVKQNLVAGLERIGQPYHLNPPEWAVTPYVGVLTNVAALRWAIAAKRTGHIQRLVAGPNLVVLPDEHDGILTAQEIDCVVTPSAWVSRLYESICPSLAGHTVEWAVGVDQDFWRPSEQSDNEDVCDFLICQKIQQPHNMPVVESVIGELRRRNLSCHVLAYGGYTPSEYRSLLHRSRAMIFFSESESQGIALFEAWSCGVPTLIWDRQRWESGSHVFAASSAPYLRPTCGLSFQDASSFSRRLDEFLDRMPTFSPRRMILESFTLELSAQAYVRLLLGLS